LVSPKNDARPTLDMVKESLFNIIAPDVYGSAFLDLYAGSGAIGLEALSRGAGSAVFVDLDISAVNKNVVKTRMAARARVLKMNVVKVIEQLTAGQHRFDFVYADPPYDKGLAEKTAMLIAKYDVLAEDGLFMVEYSKDEPAWDVPQGLVLKRKKIYSNCIIDFLKKDENR
jgi:16S rRNA (guanine966-N2)-methyltransferase